MTTAFIRPAGVATPRQGPTPGGFIQRRANSQLAQQLAILFVGSVWFAADAQAQSTTSYNRQTAPAAATVRLTHEPQLFVDEYLVAASTNVARTTHPPQRALDRPILGWESGTAQPYVTVLRDPASLRFRMWYNKHLGPASAIAYAESDDGIAWRTPSLGILGDNNELFRTGSVRTAYGVSVIDEGPAAMLGHQRFKMAWWGQEKPAPSGDPGMRVAFSADGLRWTPYEGNPVLPDYSIDTEAKDPRRLYGAGDIVDVFRDSDRHQYVALVKTPAIAADGFLAGPRAAKYIRRLVSQSVSRDFSNWSQPQRIVVPEPRDQGLLEFYGVGGTIARGGLMIGFVRMLHDDYAATTGEPADGIGYTTLVTSRDGKHWHRHDDVFFDRDPNPEAWDHAMSWVACVVPVGDEYFLYYGGYRRGHKIEPLKERQFGLARMRRNRFVSRAAKANEIGLLKTVAITLPNGNSRMVLNADSSQGEIRVRVINAQTQIALPHFDWNDCSPVTGNGLELPVHWRVCDALPVLDNRAPLRFEFQLKQAEIYGFQLVALGQGERQ